MLQIRYTWTLYPPVNMPLRADTGPLLGRCCQHRPSKCPVLAHTGRFTGPSLSIHAFMHLYFDYVANKEYNIQLLVYKLILNA